MKGVSYILVSLFILAVDITCVKLGVDLINMPSDAAVFGGWAIILVPLYLTVALLGGSINRYFRTKEEK